LPVEKLLAGKRVAPSEQLTTRYTATDRGDGGVARRNQRLWNSKNKSLWKGNNKPVGQAEQKAFSAKSAASANALQFKP
jgi:hypothetical protein